MFVRWKRYLSDYGQAAYLVECRRVNGQPQQRVVCYLGSINWVQAITRGRDGDIGMQVEFWMSADARLNELSFLPEQREIIAATLATTVPRATAAERSAYRAERYASMMSTALVNGNPWYREYAEKVYGPESDVVPTS